MAKRQRSLFDPKIVRAAVKDSFRKLHPRVMVRNPVMFVVYAGSFLTTGLWIQALAGSGEAPAGFILDVALWLWFTVLFANFAEAMAEGRGKAQAAALRKTRQTTTAKKIDPEPPLPGPLPRSGGEGERPDAEGRLVERAGETVTYLLDDRESAVAQWVFDHGRMAGRTTATLPAARGLYLPLRTSRGTVGVLGVHPADPRLLITPDRLHLLEAFANQIALAVE